MKNMKIFLVIILVGIMIATSTACKLLSSDPSSRWPDPSEIEYYDTFEEAAYHNNFEDYNSVNNIVKIIRWQRFCYFD